MVETARVETGPTAAEDKTEHRPATRFVYGEGERRRRGKTRHPSLRALREPLLY
jgi:hypothetical protein